jgi:aquaporin NIP
LASPESGSDKEPSVITRSRWSADIVRRALAEGVGAFALVFAGCGAVIVESGSGATGRLTIAITFGLVIMAMIYAVGHISGAHFNPAVTLAFALSRHFPWRLVPVYWGAQVTGAIAAALALRGVHGNVVHLGATQPAGAPSESFVLEIVLTFFLMFVIVSVATDVRAVGHAAAIAIGATVAVGALAGGPISGASMNPARSIGPAIVSGTGTHLWIYLTAPVAGAVLGALVYGFIREGAGAAHLAREKSS